MDYNLKKELIELYNSFDRAKNFYEMGYIVSMFNLLSSIRPNDLDFMKMFQQVNSKLNIYSDYYNHHTLSREKKINAFMKKKRNFFDNRINKIPSLNNIYDGYLFPLSEGFMASTIKNFLTSIDTKLAVFYQKMVNENRILYGNQNIIAYTSLDKPNTVIVIEKLENLNDIMILMHELGHAYYFYTNNVKIGDRENILLELKEEIPSKVLEIKFIKFLEDNGIYEQSKVLSNIFDSIIYDHDNNRDDYISLKYLIGSIIAKTVKYYDFDITEYYKHVYKSDIYNLVNESNNEKKLGKVLSK